MQNPYFMDILDAAKNKPQTYMPLISIEPYGRYSLGKGASTVSLVDGNAPDVQLVTDGAAVRLSLGNCLWFDGVQREIRNPYSFPIRVKLAWGLPPNMNAAPAYNDLRVNIDVKSKVMAIAGVDTGRKNAALMMAHRSHYFVTATGHSNQHMYILPKAQIEYMDTMPVGLQGELTPYTRAGNEQQDVVVREGSYTDVEIAQWVNDAGWQSEPIQIEGADGSFQGVIGPDVALMFVAPQSNKFELNAELTEIGNFNAEIVV